jgi:hypothetical protein
MFTTKYNTLIVFFHFFYLWLFGAKDVNKNIKIFFVKRYQKELWREKEDQIKKAMRAIFEKKVGFNENKAVLII